ncbi:MAG: cyclic nucleotide-binding domain-containing protein [SAR324 cluster bacterium]|nr:cyclic nucleotide-binding domain-containing protein [SAR324 cluster bacterium]
MTTRNQPIFEENRQIIQYLKASPFFKTLPDSSLEQLLQLTTVHEYNQDETILQEGQFNDRVFLLIHGKVGVYTHGERILELHRTGDIFGEMSVISSNPTSAAVVTETPVEVLSLSAKDLHLQLSHTESMEQLFYRLFSVILTEKLTLTTDKAKQYEETNRTLEHTKTELEQINHQLTVSLREKEVLLQEVHHRVKNNLQVVSSLIRLQAMSLKDPEYVKVLQASQDRISAMALVHERLYSSESLSTIDLESYVQKLIHGLSSGYQLDPNKIVFEIKIHDVTLHLDESIPIGLILNELVSNAIKHAFPGKKSGTIQIEFNEEHPRRLLIIQDDGAGFPEHLDFRKTSSLGLQLVTGIVEEQLNGTIELQREHGTRFLITIPESPGTR